MAHGVWKAFGDQDYIKGPLKPQEVQVNNGHVVPSEMLMSRPEPAAYAEVGMGNALLGTWKVPSMISDEVS